MSTNLIKLKALRDKIIGLDMQLVLIESELLSAEKDVEFFRDIVSSLKENILILKKEGVIAIALEYKKIKTEIKNAKNSLAFYTRLHEKLLYNFDMYKDDRDRYIKKYDELKEKIDNEKIVVPFDKNKRKK